MMDFESAAIRIGAEYVTRCTEAVSERAKEYCTNAQIRDAIGHDCDALHGEVNVAVDEAVFQEFGRYGKGAKPFLSPAIAALKEGVL